MIERQAGERALRASAVLWFAVATLGQFAFVLYIAGFYGRAAAEGDFARWNQVLVGGYVAGAHIFAALPDTLLCKWRQALFIQALDQAFVAARARDDLSADRLQRSEGCAALAADRHLRGCLPSRRPGAVVGDARCEPTCERLRAQIAG